MSWGVGALGRGLYLGFAHRTREHALGLHIVPWSVSLVACLLHLTKTLVRWTGTTVPHLSLNSHVLAPSATPRYTDSIYTTYTTVVYSPTEPDKERIDRRAGQLVGEFKDMVFPDGYTPGAKPKRKTAAATAAEQVTEADIKRMAQAGTVSRLATRGRAGTEGDAEYTLGKLTVPVLKEFCKQAGVKFTGNKKQDVIDAISEHFQIE
ncbi:X-ray repair cross-complementing protein 6 [Branchiostoma belcheri]|nr:X-ray repair cross-complementing protein 6 [Branchiostoma belcheri]